MKKRLLSLSLACTLLFSLFTLNASAASSLSQKEAERAELRASVYMQLEAQDALHLLDHFYGVVDNMIEEKYGSSGISPSSSSATTSYYAPHGGIFRAYGYMQDIEVTYYNVEDTQEIYNAQKQSYDLLDMVVSGILGKYNIPYYEIIYLETALLSFTNDIAWSVIDVGNEGCRVEVYNDHTDFRSTSVLLPWDPPYIEIEEGPYFEVYYYKIFSEDDDG